MTNTTLARLWLGHVDVDAAGHPRSVEWPAPRPRHPRQARQRGPGWGEGTAWSIYRANGAAHHHDGALEDADPVAAITAQVTMLSARLAQLEERPPWESELIEACRPLDESDRATVLALARRLVSTCGHRLGPHPLRRYSSCRLQQRGQAVTHGSGGGSRRTADRSEDLPGSFLMCRLVGGVLRNHSMLAIRSPTWRPPTCNCRTSSTCCCSGLRNCSGPTRRRSCWWTAMARSSSPVRRVVSRTRCARRPGAARHGLCRADRR